MNHIGKLIDFSFFLPKLKLLLLKDIVLFSMELEDLNIVMFYAFDLSTICKQFWKAAKVFGAIMCVFTYQFCLSTDIAISEPAFHWRF